MSPFVIAKGAVHLLSAMGVGKVVSDIIKTNTVVETLTDKILVNTGGLVIGSMITEAASKHVTSQIESAVSWYKDSKDEEQLPEE